MKVIDYENVDYLKIFNLLESYAEVSYGEFKNILKTRMEFLISLLVNEQNHDMKSQYQGSIRELNMLLDALTNTKEKLVLFEKRNIEAIKDKATQGGAY